MNTLPKDIIKLLLFKYLNSFDAINVICCCKFYYSMFHNEIDKLKKSCFAEMNKFIFSKKEIKQPRSYNGDVICICGQLLKKKNLLRHKKKNYCIATKQSLCTDDIMNDYCRFCSLKLLSWEKEYVLFHNGRQHMMYCAAINKMTQQLYWKSVKPKSKSYIDIIKENILYVYHSLLTVW